MKHIITIITILISGFSTNIYSQVNLGTNSGSSGSGYTFVGYGAGHYNTSSGDNNSNYGYYSGRFNNYGDNNTIIGNHAGYNNTGYENTFIGKNAGLANTSGSNNAFLGSFAGYRNTASYNTFLGYNSGYENTTGTLNTFTGYRAGHYNKTASYNTFNGGYAGFYNTTGAYNTNIGYNSGYKNTIGSYNVVIGFEAGYNNIEGSRNVFIGYKAGYDETTFDKLYIANNSSSPLIYGDFAAKELNFNSNVDIKNENPELTIVSNSVNKNASIYMLEQNNTMGFEIKYEGTSANLFQINRYDGSSTGVNVLSIKRSGGYIGIGTTSPAAQLEIVGKTKTDNLQIDNQNSTSSSTKVLVINADGTVSFNSNISGASTWNEITGKPKFALIATSGNYNDLTNKPTLFNGTWTSLTGKPTFATVATSGSYNDLTDKPTFTPFSGQWTDILGKPTFASVATSGSYNDLSDKPTFTPFSGLWTDILGRPTFAPVATTGSYDDLTDKPTFTPFSGQWTDILGKPTFASVATSGSYNDLSDKPTFTPFSGLWTDILGRPTFASVATTGSYDDLTDKPTFTPFSGSWNDIIDKPTKINDYGITDAMTISHDAYAITASEIANWNTAFGWSNHADAGYLTSYTETDPVFNTSEAKKILDSGSGMVITDIERIRLNTAYLWGSHSNLYKSIDYIPDWNEVSGKPIFSTVATTGNYDDLVNKPTIPTVPTLSTVATSGDYNDLINKPVIEGNLTCSWLEISNKPSFASVATSGDYNDLINKPIINESLVFSWDELTNKPSTIAGYGIIDAFDGDYDNLTNTIWNKDASGTYYTGNVAIGTSFSGFPTNNYNLFVEGGIISDVVRVLPKASWPDFVFNHNYQLRPLSEVEQFIKQNSHLPDIPSAEEVAKEGIDVGEMNAKLLQKIEELTLYAIELEKQVKTLQEQSNDIEHLQSENEAIKAQLQQIFEKLK